MDLAARVREDFGIPLVGVHPTGLGADERAALFRGVTADGTAYAVKTSSAPQPGLVVADFLARQGIRGVPRPVATTDGPLSSVRDGERLSLVPWVEGPRAIDVGLTGQQWQAFGELLGGVHATAPAPPLVGADAILPVDGHDPAVEVSRARDFSDRLRRATVAVSDDEVIDELAALWLRSGEDVLAVAARAETTASAPCWADARPVICHADPHHGNLLLGETDPRDSAAVEGDPGGSRSGAVWLVDWDDAVLAPIEADLIFVVGGVFSFAPITSAEQGWFFDGYTPASGGVTRSDLDPDRLTYYRSVRALTDFLDFADEALDRGRTPAERATALRIARAAVSAGGIVPLTLSEARAGH